VLRKIGLITAQGYLFSRPLGAADLTTWLEHHKKGHLVATPPVTRATS
jgi:EAL domain-containing protein (putative c-di-GMP-specific phosphodiesterase class I)